MNMMQMVSYYLNDKKNNKKVCIAFVNILLLWSLFWLLINIKNDSTNTGFCVGILVMSAVIKTTWSSFGYK